MDNKTCLAPWPNLIKVEQPLGLQPSTKRIAMPVKRSENVRNALAYCGEDRSPKKVLVNLVQPLIDKFD
jgi:hypothetical protein